MAQFHEKIYQMLKNLLQLSPETKHRILSWLGNCLHANAGRTKIWANQMPEIFFQMYASDAFFLNLGAALLKLCQPFCKPRSPRLLTFDPTYCALKELNEEERRSKNMHMKGRYARNVSICFHLGSCALGLPHNTLSCDSPGGKGGKGVDGQWGRSKGKAELKYHPHHMRPF